MRLHTTHTKKKLPTTTEKNEEREKRTKICCVFLFVRKSVITTGSMNTFAYIQINLNIAENASALTKTVHFLNPESERATTTRK